MDVALFISHGQYWTGEVTEMNTGNHRTYADKTDQVFKFFIKSGSVTRATVTILAEDIDVAWNRVNALFPGSDLSETDVQHADRH